MKKLLLVFGLVFCAAHAHAATCPISAGASQSTINSVIVNCASGNTVTYAAGTYTQTSPINVPCGVSITGPTVAFAKYTGSDGIIRMGYTPTAFVTWAGAAESTVYQLPGSCSTAAGFTYMDVNGGRPSPYGGQVLNFNPGISNFTVFGNFIHGNQGNAADGNWFQSGLVEFDGDSGSPIDNNISVTWNRFGTSGDCSNLMTNTAYAGFGGNGGFCNGVGEHNGMNNYTLTNNVFSYNENESKFYEGAGRCVNCNLSYNDFTQFHRIAMENQSNSGASNPTNQTVDFNSLHDAIFPATATFGLSIANGCTNVKPPPGTSSCISNVDGNVIAANTPPPLADPFNRYADSIEWWGSLSTMNYNFLMGMANSIMIADDGAVSVNGNLIYNPAGGVCTPGSAAGGYFNVEDFPANTATGTGNQCFQSAATQLVSVAPSISPASGSFTTSQTWNVQNFGTNRDSNTNAWCTTDGSTPVPGQGTAIYHASGMGGTVSATTTVKCVGMWGQGNQPSQWPAGYGYSQSAVVQVTYTLASGGGLFISPSGSDSNPGTMASPWLTPNHAIACGTTITALSGTYVNTNFGRGKWGTVTCPGANNVAWLTCQTFDTCKINVTTGTTQGMLIDASFWGVSGWEATSSTSVIFGTCFAVQPSGSSTVHHVIFADDIANGCTQGGFSASASSATASVDYITFVGDIAYNSAQGTDVCASNFSVFEPAASDTASGTHIYMAGNFSYEALNGTSCDGSAAGKTTDGEGYNLDTFDYSQTAGGVPYTQQAAVENNIAFLNGGFGIVVENNSAGSTHAPIFIQQNTLYADSRDPNRQFCIDNGDLNLFNALNVTAEQNLIYTGFATNCSTPSPYFAMAVAEGGSSDTVDSNYASGVAGNNTYTDGGGGFAYGPSNIIGTNPAFTNPVNPGAPSCGSFASTVACMATVIANFAPTVSAAVPYGYQKPTGTSVTDPLFPPWLCSGQSLVAGFPTGLINPGCGGPTPTLASGFQSNSGSLTSIAVGGTPIQQIANGRFSDGSTHPLPFFGYTATWSSSDPTKLGVGGTGLITGVAAGTANSIAVASPGGVTLTPWTWTVTGGTPIPNGGFLGNSGDINRVAAGSAGIQFTAYVTYSNQAGFNALPDGFGNSVASWSIVPGSSTCGSVTAGGLFSPTTVGTCNVKAVCNCTTAATLNQWTMTVTAPSTPAPPAVQVIIISEIPAEWREWSDGFESFIGKSSRSYSP